MSNTRHHRGQRANKAGHDFGKRYKCDKHWSGGTGRVPKTLAHKEMRNESKVIIQRELNEEE